MIIQSIFTTFSFDDEWILLGENRDSNPVNWKKGRFVEWHRCAHERQTHEPLGGSRGMLHREKL